jgi:nitric oxide reductase subunit B
MGTTLTANHGHAAMFGVFGMLALGVLVFCMRAMQSDEVWGTTEKLVKFGYWGLNIGLALMVVLDLFPAGVLQLWDVLENGYWHARSLSFIMTGTFHTVEWIRIAGDLVFLLCGVFPIVLAAIISYLNRDLKPAME